MQSADALALLDIEGGERFTLPGAEGLLSPEDLPHDAVVRALDDPRFFITVVGQGRSCPANEIPRLQAYWRMRHGLVDGDDLTRLLWLLSKFSREIEVDLHQHVGVDLGELWRGRRWRLLLNLLDHLPRATWTQQAMAGDQEYSEKVAEALASRSAAGDVDPDVGPPLVEYSPEVAALASVVDAVNALRVTFIQANLEKGKEPPRIPPYPRPRPLLDRLVEKKERALRWAAHESLASRLLPERQTNT